MVKIQYKNLSQLLYSDFNISNIKVAKSHFKTNDTTNYIKIGRKQNLLHLITSGEREYIFNDRSFSLKSGSVLFIPDGTNYSTTANTTNDACCSGIGICFDITDQNGNIILIEPDVYYDWGDRLEKAIDYFEQIDKLYKYSSEAFTLKITILKLLHTLTKSQTALKGDFTVLEPALNFIAEHYNENLAVSLYAKQCKLSESHFRKRFTECMGISPIDYRNELRFRKAKRLYQNKYTLQEIADIVGFNDAGYLSKMYKKHTGTSLRANSEIV